MLAIIFLQKNSLPSALKSISLNSHLQILYYGEGKGEYHIQVTMTL